MKPGTKPRRGWKKTIYLFSMAPIITATASDFNRTDHIQTGYVIVEPYRPTDPTDTSNPHFYGQSLHQHIYNEWQEAAYIKWVQQHERTLANSAIYEEKWDNGESEWINQRAFHALRASQREEVYHQKFLGYPTRPTQSCNRRRSHQKYKQRRKL